jgi:hypothetical protein
MGLCQGRECGHIVAALAGHGGPGAGSQTFAARMPLRPVPMATALSLSFPATGPTGRQEVTDR